MSVCAECGREIGWLGRARGARYCSNEHRVRALAYQRVQSATATVREREKPSVAETALSALARAGSDSNVRKRYRIGFSVVLAGAVVIGTTGLPSRQTMASSGAAVANEVRKHAAIRLFDDFHGNFESWTPVAAHLGRGSWVVDHGFLRPGELRIWADSTALTDYQFEFAGQIRDKALNWVFRATDADNYEACRLEVTRPGPLPIVDFVRFTRTDGTASRAIRRPLPMTVRADTVYEVRVQVRGSDFTTTVNGQIVETWSDSKHPVGGVGFWTGKGESASIRYARVTERDDLTGRVLADLLQPADKK